MPQVNLMDASIPETTDPTNGYEYIVKENVDYRILTANKFKGLLRIDMDVDTDGTSNQRINYSSPFLNQKPIIFDYEGIGIEVIAFDASGFNISSDSIVKFGYLNSLTV